ncbi:trimethylamine N-oxide reductase system protein TorE [Photobacterium japonica]|uniref:trimethylamine N-oxide reductase system protein TorE n=1 Tax=Photobacterium japonica TaxID=2910235 RepID=UPI003D0AB928
MDNRLSMSEKKSKTREWMAFFFITVVLFPLLSVIAVGGYGFTIWMLQLFVMGPPGHGA